MQAPLYSTITLIAELFVSASIYYSRYKHNRFPVKLATSALLYEILFNISYMAMQVPEHAKAARVESPFVIGLAIIHGVLSLIMFITLVIFFILAFKNYRKGINYFKKHKIFTIIFIFFWTFSIVSGIFFYFVEYIF
jgi:hypothetical protein